MYGDLINDGRRHRNPSLARFLQPDPLEYVDGLNVYLYCGNNPWGRFDPEGLIFHRVGEFMDRAITAIQDNINKALPVMTEKVAKAVDYATSKADSVIDYTKKQADSVSDYLQNSPRLTGSLQAVGGIAQAGSAIALTSGTGCGATPFSSGLFLLGADNFLTGLNQVWYGADQKTLLNQGLNTFLPEDAASIY